MRPQTVLFVKLALLVVLLALVVLQRALGVSEAPRSLLWPLRLP